MEKELYDLTAPQKSIWLTEQYYKNTNINNVCGTFMSLVPLDFSVFEQAIKLFVKSNESFRIKLTFKNGNVKQYFDDYSDFNIKTVLVNSDEERIQLERKINSKVFGLLNSSLFEFTIFKYPNGNGGFIVNANHIISDSWTSGIIANEISTIYCLLKSNEKFEKNSEFSYLNYIKTEQEYLNSEKFKKDKQYWDSIFKTVPEIATIPSINQSTNSNISYGAKRYIKNLNSEKLENLKEFCKKNKISLYNLFMGVFALYLGRVSNLDDFVIGTPILNRTNFKEKQITGMFINVLPLRFNLNHELEFTQFVSKVGTDSMGLLRHQRYSYNYILEDLRKKDSSLPGLYNVLFSYQVTKMNENNEDLPHITSWNFNESTANDLDIHVFEWNDSNTLQIAYDYKTDKYSEEEISATHERILHVLDQIIDNENILLKEIEIVTPEEKNKILYEFNNTKAPYPKDKTIAQLFEEQVEKTPDNIAVVFEDQKLTYRELNEKANQLANYLVQKNVKFGDVIGIFLDKSLEIVISMLAILKANCTFLPFDIEYPEERISYIINDSHVKYILSSNNFKKILPDISIDVSLSNENLIYSNFDKKNIKPKNSSSEDIMYIIYTSGSTGNPKGVLVKHKNIVRLVINQNFIKFNSHEVMVQTGTIAFDACIFEIFGALLHGFKLHILKKDILLNINKFENFLVSNNVSILFLTTGLFNELGNLNAHIFRNLRYLLTGGDVISISAVEKIQTSNPSINLINCYGPTENGSYSTCFNIPSNWSNSYIPIGKPIANSTAYIVSKYGNLQPIGIPGELWVGGDGIGKGYVNREELTKNSFFPSPFNSDYLYKTGDLVKYDNLNNICFIGRIDNQIKLRGFRIELSEIDSAILHFPDIKESLSIVKKEQNNSFILSYITSDSAIDIENLKKYLFTKLPKYMLPTEIIQIKNFPLNINGKIDRKSLPLPNFENNKIIIQSRNSFDYFLIESLGDLLNLNIANISIDDNFFELGGDSLSAINLSSKIYSKLNIEIFVKDIINNPKICDLSDLISTKVSISTNILKHIETQKYYPTSSAQQNIYIASNIAGENSLIYNIPGVVIFDKKPDIKRLEKCFNKLIKRHESFRTYFELKDDTIVQKIIDKIDFKIEILENTISEDSLDNEFKNFVKPFDLSCAPLLRARLINLENNKNALLVDMHHIISDGTSLSIFINELCKLYNGEKLENIEFTYKDFAYWENEALNSQKFEEASKYWLDQFEGDIPVLNMPKTYSRPAVKSYEGSKVYTTINSETVNKINNICKEYSITPYMLLLSVYYILLSKYTSQDDIVVGSPIVGRNFSEAYNIIGMFVNTLPVRAKIDNSLSFKEILNNVKSICLENYKYQNYPLNELISKLNIKRDTSRNPLFDTLFTYQNNGLTNINFNGIDSKIYIPDTKISKFDFSLEIVPENDILNLNFEYCTKLFNKQFIESFAKHYKNILEIVLDNLDIKLNSICILSEKEKNKILYEFNNTKSDYPKDKTIAQIFEEQVEKNPDNIAVVFQNKKLTYKELNEKSNQLANYLLNKGIQKNKPIAVLLDRSINLIISMLAIIKCGGIYLPISTEYPSDRINYIIENSNTKFIITNNDNSLFINTSINAINLEKINLNNFKKQNINIDIKPNNGLYIIYTSGSTGNPKGVEVSHKNLNNFIHSFNTLFKTISSNDKLLASTYICFDVSIFEFFFSLLNGMSLYLYNENSITDIFNYCNYIINNNITTLYIPPNILNDVYEILRNNNYTNLHNLLLGVEPIKSAIIKKYYSLNPFMKIINAYGPTETTICSTATIASAEILNNYKIIPIGKPLNNLKLFILDNQFNPVPVGIPGELYISGDNVSNGYYLNKDLTDKNFISLPNITNKKLYKTGDIVMWNEDGNISFVGRNDSQIKFNGHRIELGEIGTAICDYPNIDKCIVLINNTKLIAYYTSSSKINTNDLQAFIKTKLPIYSIPNFLIQIKKFKLTSNGKIDKNYLKSLKITSSTEYEAPSTPIEKALIKMFENILNIKKIGVNDNFFELGGDSISAIKLQIESFNRGLNIPYKNIFDFPTVKQLANNITKSKNKLIEDKYDYSKIDSLLKNNLSTNTIKKENFKNILLTGSTGFLGAHILDYLLKNTKLNIYCIIRPQKDTDPQTRLLDVLHFYFGNQYDNLVFKRLFIIEGDITKKNLGMSSLVSKELGISLDCIINSAAIVKHYGNSNVFSETNISGTQNIIDFCNKFNCKLVHISTLSVSGNIFEDEKYTVSDVSKGTTFSEKNLFINQDLSNIYIYTKFIAERLILENILNNKLNAKIIRVGNLTNRYSDGKFQKNISENAFLNRFKSFIDIGILPDYLKEMYLEFTPVDSCAEAICKLSLNKMDSIIYHLYNNNHITLPKLLEILNSININIEFVSKNVFDEKVNLLLKDSSNSYLSGIINDFDENKNLVYDNNINFKNKITNTLLKQLSFEWPKIDKEYIKNYIIYLRSIGLIK